MHAQTPAYGRRALFEEAETFLTHCYDELDREDELDDRIEDVWHAIGKRGHYEHTPAELEHGARMAWRNSNRCIGRHFWDSLNVLDYRDVDTAEGVFDALCHHIEYATNGGAIRPTVSVFPPEIRGERQVRLWNYQLIRYAGYRTDDGIVGDPDSLAFTEYCQSRGWAGDGTEFDVLPLVIQIGDEEPELFELPEEIVWEVPLSHPEYDWFADLGLRWYAVPIVSNMHLEIGGIRYTAAPFNGWYMGTEIGARNLTDEDRYDLLPTVGDRLGLDTAADRSLWKDRAIATINRAVVHSYDDHGVRIVDHHSAADQFQQFEQAEAEAGREVTGDRSWLVPPSAPATTHVFHSSYDDTVKTPNFFYREEPY